MARRVAAPVWLALVLGLLLAPSAGAAPPVSAPLLEKFERDIAGALTQVRLLGEVGGRGDGPVTVVGGLGIADSEAPVALAGLRNLVGRLDGRLEELDREARARADPRLQQVVWIMRQELRRLRAAVEELAAEPAGRDRRRAIRELEHAFVQLDGATAALWTFE